ncbi:MAG TPA: hypothetical protein VEL79_12570 [Vicinamibacterales bacterium]|nr:hypothetical protein [Vicinamibacterales bacterium]
MEVDPSIHHSTAICTNRLTIRARESLARYLNIQRRGLDLAMEKLEENRRLAEEQRQKKAEEEKRKKAESVAHVLHTADESSPAFVPDLGTSTPRGRRRATPTRCSTRSSQTRRSTRRSRAECHSASRPTRI